MIKSSNPIINKNKFRVTNVTRVNSETMTVQNTAIKSVLLLAILIISAGWIWQKFFISYDLESITKYMTLGLFGGLICAIIIMFKNEWAPYIAPIYSLLEGFAIGGISAFVEAQFPGIALQATSLTFGTLAIMLFLYSSKIIKVTDKLKMGIVSALGAIFLVRIVSMFMGFFGMKIPFIDGSGPIGIAFSLVVVGVAAFSLLLDFDAIEEGERQRAPSYMEWYSAFGLMVSLVYLYINILILLSKFRDRNN